MQIVTITKDADKKVNDTQVSYSNLQEIQEIYLSWQNTESDLF